MSRCRKWIAVVALLAIATALVATVTPQQAEAASLKSRLQTARYHLRHAKHRLKDARAALVAALAAQSGLTVLATPSPTPTPTPSATDPAIPGVTPTPEATPTLEATPTPEPTPLDPTPEATATAEATPTPEATVTTEATPTPEATVTTEATPTPAASRLASMTTATPSATATEAPTIDQLRASVYKARHSVRVWHRRVELLAKRYQFQLDMARWEQSGNWRPIIEVAAAKYHVNADGVYRMMIRESGGQRYAGSSTAFKGLFQYYTGTWAASWNPYRHDSIYDGTSQIFATCYAISRGMGASMWTTTYWSQY